VEHEPPAETAQASAERVQREGLAAGVAVREVGTGVAGIGVAGAP
jgi:hypothetical protein